MTSRSFSRLRRTGDERCADASGRDEHSSRSTDDEQTTEAVLAYQLAVLKAEFDHGTIARAKHGGPGITFFKRQAWQFYWTVSRLLRRDLSLRQTVTFSAATRQMGMGRLLIDVSSTFSSSARTGIQRVVKQFVEACAGMGLGCAVLVRDGRLVHADESEAKFQPVQIEPGDVLFLLDSSWTAPEAVRSVIKDIQKDGCHVVAGVHDIIPIQFPSTCNQETIRHFTAWLDMVLHTCDAFLCVSETTARALSSAACERLAGRRTPPIGWFTLGAILPQAPEPFPSTGARRPYVLMVGTLEPRKGHPIALDALETLWRRGVDLDLVILGRRGWNMRFFEKRLRTHPEMDRRLFWMSDSKDDELVRAYQGASALIYPSIAEGYGLPVIEAAMLGTTVILSDIAVFREVAPPGSIFFKPCCPCDLAAKITDCLREQRLGASTWSAPTWSESVEEAVRIIANRAYQINT